MKHVYMPFGNMKRSTLPGTSSRVGRGMGSVLLQTGGPGSASSYPSLDQYEATTGVDPFARSSSSTRGRGMLLPPELGHPSSKGLGPSLKSKIRALIPSAPKERKPKNINFSI